MTGSLWLRVFHLEPMGDRPLRLGESLRFDTMPSRPSLQARLNTVGPSSSMFIEPNPMASAGQDSG
jgi:hypothetical protein